jgi:hypothetical protein
VSCPEGTSTSGTGAISCDITLDLKENSFSDSIGYYPNPSNGEVTFNFNSKYDFLNLEIIDLYGKKLLSKKFENTSAFKVNMQRFANGKYIFKIWNASEVAVFGILKQ